MNKKLTLVLASTAVAGGIALGASALPAMASTTSPSPSASSSADSSTPTVDGSTDADRTQDSGRNADQAGHPLGPSSGLSGLPAATRGAGSRPQAQPVRRDGLLRPADEGDDPRGIPTAG